MTEYFSTHLFALSACAIVLAACNEGSPDGGSDGQGGMGGSDSAGDESTEGSGGSASVNGDAPFYAEGTYNGESFQVECNFDDTDPDWTAGLQCQDDTQFFITCRLDPEDDPVAGLEPSSFQVWFYLHTGYTSVGTHDAAGQPGICVGNNGGAPLCTNSGGELEAAEIDVQAIDLWNSASGTFSASWADSGENYATIQGSFDFTCD